jgi:ATP-dependent helicase/nuclease subunit B
LRNAGGKPFALDLEGYAALVAQILSERVFQEEPQLHPRIRLLSPLSARLLSADIMILAGLNEGCWPARVEADSWLGRSQRGLLGLPPLERRAGQAAADFMSFASAGRCVYLTRSRTSDGSMTRPSRWIARLSALVSGASLAIDRGARWFELLQAGAKTAQPIEPPAPRPPLAARPRRLSVTAVESWLANPYAIYARHILKLDPLRGFHEGAGPRERGILLHDALHSFFRDTSVTASLDSDRLMACYIRAAEEAGLDLNSAPFWALRFRRFADWFVESERERRKGVSDVRTEIPAKLMLTLRIGSTFDLTARIDRIDLREDSSAIIYDYKTSNSAGDKGSKRGAPQLALEAYLLREGAVAGLSGAAEIAFSYIIATGGEPPGKLVQPKGNSADLIAAAQVGLKKLIERFDDEATPYTFAQRPIFKDKAAYDVYAHLARVKEWGGTSDEAADD